VFLPGLQRSLRAIHNGNIGSKSHFWFCFSTVAQMPARSQSLIAPWQHGWLPIFYPGLPILMCGYKEATPSRQVVARTWLGIRACGALGFCKGRNDLLLGLVKRALHLSAAFAIKRSAPVRQHVQV